MQAISWHWQVRGETLFARLFVRRLSAASAALVAQHARLAAQRLHGPGPDVRASRAVLGVIVGPLEIWTWSLLGVALALRCAVAFTVGVGILGDRQVLKNSWLIPLRDLIAVGIWAASLAGRRVVWRGRQFTLENGELRP